MGTITYRTTRNIENSLRVYLQGLISTDWNNEVKVLMSFTKAYDTPLPVVVINSTSAEHRRIELGSNSTEREVSLIVHVFAKRTSGKKDLTDYLVGKIKEGFNYYQFYINNGVESKTLEGYVEVKTIRDEEVMLGDDKANLDEHDKHRTTISMVVTLNKVE